MANMGVDRLILIAPPPVVEETKQGAAHAQSILRDAVVYESYADFIRTEGEGVRIALSGKDARLKVPDWLDETLERLVASGREHSFFDDGTPIYLMFGPEDDGLSAEEMELCHFVCRLPTFGEITSLNISHAVLLTCYMVQTSLGRRAGAAGAGGAASAGASGSGAAGAGALPVQYPSAVISKWLTALGFDLSSPRINIEKTLNRIFLSSCPTPDELRTVESVLQQTVRKLGMRRE